VYFLAHDEKYILINRFSNEKQKLVNSMRNSLNLYTNNTDLFLNGNSVYFAARYEANGALWTVDFIKSSSSLNWIIFTGYRPPLSIATDSKKGFLITLVPLYKIDHAMMYHVHYERENNWELRMTLENLDSKKWCSGSAQYYHEKSVYYKLDYFDHYYFYSIGKYNQHLVNMFEIPNESENLLNNGKIWISQYKDFLYLFNIEWSSDCTFLVFDATSNRFIDYQYTYSNYIRFLGLSGNKVIFAVTQNNTNSEIRISPIDSINASPDIFVIKQVSHSEKKMLSTSSMPREYIFKQLDLIFSFPPYYPLKVNVDTYFTSSTHFNLKPWRIEFKTSMAVRITSSWNFLWGDVDEKYIKIHKFENSSKNNITFSSCHNCLSFSDWHLQYIFGDEKKVDFLIVININGTEYSKLLLTSPSPMIDHWRNISSNGNWNKCFTGYRKIHEYHKDKKDEFIRDKYGEIEYTTKCEKRFQYIDISFLMFCNLTIWVTYIAILLLILFALAKWQLLEKYNEFYIHLAILSLGSRFIFDSDEERVYLWWLNILFAFRMPFFTFPVIILELIQLLQKYDSGDLEQYLSFDPYFTSIYLFYSSFIFYLYENSSLPCNDYHQISEIHKKLSMSQYQRNMHFTLPITLILFRLMIIENLFKEIFECPIVLIVIIFYFLCIFGLLLFLIFYNMYWMLWYLTIESLSFTIVYGEPTSLGIVQNGDGHLKWGTITLWHYMLYFFKNMLIYCLYLILFIAFIVMEFKPKLASTLSFSVSFMITEILWLSYLLIFRPFTSKSIMNIEIMNHVIILCWAVIVLIYSSDPKKNRIYKEIFFIFMIPYGYIIHIFYLVGKKLFYKKLAANRAKRAERLRMAQIDRFRSEIYISSESSNYSQISTYQLSSDRS
jgi:hypothetical protein